MAGEGDRVLGDEVAGIGPDLFAEGLDFFLGGPRTHQHAVAAGLVGRLHHELLQILHDEGPVLRFTGKEGADILQDGLLAEVILDDLRDEVIDHLVVGDSGANAIGKADIAGAIGIHESGNTQQ